MDSNSTEKIQISFHSAESATLEGGVGAYIFYFAVKNLLPQRAKLFVAPPIYLTHVGEEIDQDAWLSGLGNGVEGFTLSSGAFKKTGCIYYDRKLPRISNGDKIMLTGWIDGDSISHEILFECTDATNNEFQFLSSSQAPRVGGEQRLATSSNLGGDNAELTHLVERLEILEEDFGVSIEGIYFTCRRDDANQYTVFFNFDVIATNRDRINEIMAESDAGEFQIQASFYNQNRQLIFTDKSYISQDEFPGFCSKSSYAKVDEIPAHIRLFPVKAAY